MKKLVLSISLVYILLLALACRKDESFYTSDEAYEAYAGGTNTVFDVNGSAFSHAFPGLTGQLEFAHGVGDGAFSASFVSAPAIIRPGLGTVYNNVSCTSCHVNDGRGQAGTAIPSGLLIRLSIPGTNPHGGPNPVPGFGGQLQEKSVIGVSPEATFVVTYTDVTGTYADGSTYTLRSPSYTFTNAYTTMPSDMMYSPRIAPPVFGLGLLEALSETTILSHADPSDANGDGISGKPNYAWNVKEQRMTLGRFGWKAAAPSLLQQVAGAYNEDMGVTNYIFPDESTTGQPQYSHLVNGVEVSDSLMNSVVFYCRTLAVPARRNISDPVVKRGKELFHQIGCAKCHIPSMRTEVNVAFPLLSNQLIFPYSDMLLHDLGPALADNRPDFDATGAEWRTSPLWGIGLSQRVNGHTSFLHDGRARNITEAILWHGGEGDASKNAFLQLDFGDRTALVKFLNSL